MPKFSIKHAAMLFIMLMIAAAMKGQGHTWVYFNTGGVVYACMRCLYDLDEKDPNYKGYVRVFVCIAAGALWVFHMFPHFANYIEFVKKFVSTHPVLEDMYEYVKKYLDEINKESPEAGVQTLEHDTYMQFVLAQVKDFEVAQNKWFGLF